MPPETRKIPTPTSLAILGFDTSYPVEYQPKPSKPFFRSVDARHVTALPSPSSPDEVPSSNKQTNLGRLPKVHYVPFLLALVLLTIRHLSRFAESKHGLA